MYTLAKSDRLSAQRHTRARDTRRLRWRRHLSSLFCGVLLLLSTVTIRADGFPDSATVYLQKNDGSELAIGQVVFSAPGDSALDTGFTLSIDTSVFSEHFLSMRPFRCLQGDTEWFCYLPYPYELRNIVNHKDLSDLEYQLLFIRKTPQEFGIDAWNGLYYRLALNEDGTLQGRLLEGDLNVLQSPPAQFAKPVDLSEFIEADSSARLYPGLIIR